MSLDFIALGGDRQGYSLWRGVCCFRRSGDNVELLMLNVEY